MLWNRSLVMLDTETESLWSQHLGKCMQGKLKDKKLELISSVIVDWKSWRERHPSTTILKMSRETRNYNRSFFKVRETKSFVFGYAGENEDKSWRLDALQEQPLINDEIDDRKLVIWLDVESGGCWAFERNLDGETLEFEVRDDTLVDTNTESIWDLTTGEALSGSLRGEKLTPVPLVPSFYYTWHTFHPDSLAWPEDPPKKGK